MVVSRRHVRSGAKFGAQLTVGVLIAALTMVWMLTQTDWGRERLRILGVDQLARRVHGEVRIGEVHGDLLTGATLVDVLITDSAGAPFLRADTVEMRYGMRALFQKHLVFQDVRLVRPVIVLDQQPGADWNVTRLFKGDTVVTHGDTIPGFGDWVRFEDVEVVQGDVTVRREWSPAGDLDTPGRDRAIERALSPDSRENVVAVPGGYQAVSTFQRVNGAFPMIRFADPDSAARVIDVARLTMVALPFRPPAAQIQGLSGRLIVTEDTLAFSALRVRLPSSLLELEGTYAFGTPSGANLRLQGERISLPDLRFVRPSLPEGHGRVDLTVRQTHGATRLSARRLVLDTEGAHVEGVVDLETGRRGLRIHGSDLEFSGLDTRVVERLVPEVDLPIDAVLAGDLRLSGTPEALDVDGRSEIRERNGAVSRVVADGTLVDAPGGQVARGLRLRFDPLQLSLVRSVVSDADLPVGGALTGRATLDGPLAALLTVDADLTHVDRATGQSRLVARGGLRLRGPVTARNLRVEMAPLRAALVRAFEPGFPLGGTFTGRATLDGVLTSRFTLDADVTHEQADGGRSRVLGEGELQVAPELVAHDLRLRLDPVQSTVLRTLVPALNVDGTVTGRVTVDGELRRQVAMTLDVTHDGSAGTSGLAGTARLAFARGLSAFDVDVAASPLALATVGRFVPAAGLRGSVSGPIVLRGTPERATVDARLDVAGPAGAAGAGRIEVRGTVGTGTRAPYDLVASLSAFDAAAVSTRAPGTLLSGRVAVRGVGTDPATADTRIVASLVDSRLPGAPRLDSTRVDVRLSDGLALIERGELRLASARADVRGSFGLTGARSGQLSYRIELDSLEQFGELAPPADRAPRVVVSRPLVRAREIRRARIDSAQVADEGLVERLATGAPEVVEVTLDTVQTALPNDSVSGRVVAEGTLSGNVERFDAQGTAELDDVVWNGNAVQSGSLVYTVTDAPTPALSVDLDARLVGVRAGGFSFDSTTASIEHTGGRRTGSGRALIAAYQDAGRDYKLTADYVLELDRSELVLADMALRFDSTTWTSTEPGTIRWAGHAVELDHIELVDGGPTGEARGGGRFFADGRLPADGSGDLTVSVAHLQLGDLVALVQDTIVTRGILTMDARFRGTLRSPLMEATLALDSASRAGQPLPDLLASFAYSDGQLTGEAQLHEGERLLLTASGEMPMNLALADRTGPLLGDGPVALDVRADSFPLQALPSLTPALAGLTGRVRGEVSVRGTHADPVLSGTLDLTQGGARIADAGITVTDGVGSFRFANDVLEIDSLVARSGGGPVRIGGTAELATLQQPVFDLDVTADEALVLANERGEVTAGLDLEVTGDLELLHVRGDVHVTEGEIDAPEPSGQQRATRLDDPTLLGVFAGLGVAEAMRPRASFLHRVDLDVNVRVDRDTWVRNSVMNVEVYTPEDVGGLRVTTDPITHDLLLEGVINADRGDYSFAGREFDLTTGSITFMGGRPDPLLQLSARHEVPRRGREALVILIAIGGTLSEPKLSLSSNVEPPIAESDLLSYLAFGRESGSLLTDDGSGIVGDALGGLGVLAEQQLAALGLGALTQGVFSNLERRGTAAGLDVFRVRPNALPDEVNFAGYQNIFETLEIQAGEYLTPQIFVSAKAQPGAGGTPALGLEWRRPDGFSWVTTWDSRFLPPTPSLDQVDPRRTRAFGTFLLWERRF